MNMKKEKTNDNVKRDLDALLQLMKFDNKEQKLRHDAFVLMAGYLSEIEAIQKKHNITRKELAKKIGDSAPYLTQVFRGNKPLNFYTIAKIKDALNIRFEVRAIDLNEKCTIEEKEYFPISTFDLSQPHLSNTFLLDTNLIKADQVETTFIEE